MTKFNIFILVCLLKFTYACESSEVAPEMMQGGMMMSRLLMNNSGTEAERSGLPNGSECQVSSECESLICYDEDSSQTGICVIACDTEMDCEAGVSCQNSSDGNICVPDSTNPTECEPKDVYFNNTGGEETFPHHQYC